MAVGALIGAYQEDDSGGLRALLPLAGRTLLEYQVRCAAGRRRGADRRRRRARAAGAAGRVRAASPRWHRRVPGQRRQRSGQPVRGGLVDPADRRRHRAAGRSGRRTGRTSPNRGRHRARRRAAQAFERIDAESRWAGRRDGRCASARLDRGDARRLGPAIDPAPADHPGRRAARCRLPDAGGEPLLVESADQLARFPAPSGSGVARRARRLGEPLPSSAWSRISRPSS